MSSAFLAEPVKVKMICRACRGENVTRDATAAWDSEHQRWELSGGPYDYSYCEDCDAETEIEAVPLGVSVVSAGDHS